MSGMTDEDAKRELRASIDQIDALTRVKRKSAAHVEWLFRTLGRLEEVFGSESRYVAQIQALKWGFSGTRFFEPFDRDLNRSTEAFHQEAYLEHLEVAKGVLRAALFEVERKGLAGVRQNVASDQTALVFKIQDLASKTLRKLIREPPADEKELQERFQDLLNAADIAFTREGDSVVYSSKSYRPDFVVEQAGLAIELKLCKKAGREKELVAEINDDLLAYSMRWHAQLFVIYDVGLIRDVERFIGDFKRDGVRVEVVKH